MVEAVRPATADDTAEVARLAAAAADELAANKGGGAWRRIDARPEPIEAAIRTAIHDPDVLVLVGTIDGVVVGYAVTEVETVADGGALARLTDLFVEREAREVSLGEILLDEVVAWATDRRCFGLDSLALPGDRETKNFFETAGMVTRALIVHRSLP